MYTRHTAQLDLHEQQRRIRRTANANQRARADEERRVMCRVAALMSLSLHAADHLPALPVPLAHLIIELAVPHSDRTPVVAEAFDLTDDI